MRVKITFNLNDQQRRAIKQHKCQEIEGVPYDGKTKATYDECRSVLENEGALGIEMRMANYTEKAK